MPRLKCLIAAVACFGMLLTAGCAGGSTVDDQVAGAGGADMAPITAGYVSAIDQLGLPVAVERGHFGKQSLDVTLSQPFPTGVDALNALQAGEVDFVQVGTPAIAAAQKGVDLVLVGNYTGSSTQRSIDETMAVVASASSGIKGNDLSTLRGKRIGVSVGSINHLYLLGLLRDVGIGVDEVEIVNTAPPDMPVALETEGIDAAIVWDPWPATITKQVAGTREVLRGGGYIPFVGYIVTTREFAENNPSAVKRFLTARVAADQWMRENPEAAAESATRWLTGTELDVARASMQHNIKQLDPRFSACNYLALDTVARMLAKQEVVEPGFEVGRYFMPAPILEVMKQSPELFQDLKSIPESAVIEAGYTYERETALQACPS